MKFTIVIHRIKVTFISKQTNVLQSFKIDASYSVYIFKKKKGNYTYFSLKLIWNIDLHHSNCVQAAIGNSVYIPVEKIFILAKEDNNLINVSLSLGDKQKSI